MATECDYYTCNAGFCSKVNNAITCTCLLGFQGDRCDIKIDNCANSDCGTGYECQDLITGHQCILMETTSSSNDKDEPEIKIWLLAIFIACVIIGCLVWLFVYIQFSKGPLKDKKAKLAPKKNLKKLKKGMTLTDYQKTKQAEREAKLQLLNSRWAFPAEDIVMANMLDTGEFCQIYLGKAKNAGKLPKEFVVKKAKNNENGLVMSEMVSEYEVLAELTGHVNIVEMFGVSYLPPRRELVLVLAYYKRGNLHQVLLEMREHIEEKGPRDSTEGHVLKVITAKKKTKWF